MCGEHTAAVACGPLIGVATVGNVNRLYCIDHCRGAAPLGGVLSVWLSPGLGCCVTRPQEGGVECS